MKRLVSFLCVFACSTIMCCAGSRQVECPDCGGSGNETKKCSCHNGAIYCTQCDYSGKVRRTCNYCNGTGQVGKDKPKVCSHCGGQRYFDSKQMVDCSCVRSGRPGRERRVSRVTGQQEWVTCSKCSGSGQVQQDVRAACRMCRGSGYSGTETEYSRCGRCSNGYVEQDCPRCSGRGAYMCDRCQGYGNYSVPCSRCHGNRYIFVYDN